MVVRPSVRINVENSGIRTLESCDSSGAKEDFRRLKSAQLIIQGELSVASVAS